MESSLTGVGLPRGDAITAGDLVLLPKYQTLVANDAALGHLTPQQREVLDQAVAETEAAAFARQPDEAELADTFCANGGSIILAGQEALAEFREVAAPLVEDIARIRSQTGSSKTSKP